MSVSQIEKIAYQNKKRGATRLYALIIDFPHTKKISLINSIEYGFIYDGIVNTALLNIFERKDIHPEYYYTKEEILEMSPEKRATLIMLNEFNSLESLEKYCQENSIDIIQYYHIHI